MGRDEGLTEGKLQALANYEASDALSDVEKLCLRYAVAMSEVPLHVTDELFDKLKSHFNEQQLVELTSCIAWENYRARFDHALGIESAEFSEGAFCPLPDHHAARSKETV